MPFHIDYRPQDFDEFIGNKDTVKQLKSLLDRSDTPQTILFQGPSGVGKTTLARITARYLKCPPELHEAVNPDFLEINTANDNGVNTAREIIRGLKSRPLHCPNRVHLLDEAHKLTDGFQNAMLKPLEDGAPAWNYFLMCTTNPQKLLPTVKRRATILNVRPMTGEEIKQTINWVLEGEDLDSVSEIAINRIVEGALGSPGEALKVLDSIVDLSLEEQEIVADQLLLQEFVSIDLCRALIKGARWKDMSEILQGLDLDKEYERIRLGVLGYMANTMLKSRNDQAALVYEAFREPFYNAKRSGLIFACWECCADSK